MPKRWGIEVTPDIQELFEILKIKSDQFSDVKVRYPALRYQPSQTLRPDAQQSRSRAVVDQVDATWTRQLLLLCSCGHRITGSSEVSNFRGRQKYGRF